MGETHVTDRRVERANRTRDKIVDALLALIEDGNFRPTAREIAARAGVSLRSLYVHFDDVEALFHAAAIRHKVNLDEHRMEVVTDGPLEQRLESFIARRARLYEMGKNVRYAAVLQEPFSPALHNILEQARQLGRAELDKVFAAELAGPGGRSRRAALDAVTQPTSWEILRTQHGLSDDEARQVLRDMAWAVLQGGPEGGPRVTPGGAEIGASRSRSR